VLDGLSVAPLCGEAHSTTLDGLDWAKLELTLSSLVSKGQRLTLLVLSIPHLTVDLSVAIELAQLMMSINMCNDD
jgi:hypothetical protein